MSLKSTSQKSSYLPVSWEFREVIEEEINKKSTGKIFFFDNNEQVGEAKGSIVEMAEETNGAYVVLDTGDKIRLDRIITLFGKIGAAYDEYDSYANACMNCTGGYEEGEL